VQTESGKNEEKGLSKTVRFQELMGEESFDDDRQANENSASNLNRTVTSVNKLVDSSVNKMLQSSMESSFSEATYPDQTPQPKIDVRSPWQQRKKPTN